MFYQLAYLHLGPCWLIFITKATTITQNWAQQFGSYKFTSSGAALGHFCISHFNNSWQLCDAFKRVIKRSSQTWLALHTHPHSLSRGRGYDGTNSLRQQCPTWYEHHSVCRGKGSSFHLFSPSIKDISTSAGTMLYDRNIAFQSRHLSTDLCPRWCIARNFNRFCLFTIFFPWWAKKDVWSHPVKV